jgi:hypothetical protein
VQERRVDLQAVGDLADTVVEDRVARDPEHAVGLALPSQREADHVADDRVAQWRAVPARRGGDLDRRTLGRIEPRGLPWLQPARRSAEPLRTGSGRHDRTGRREQGAAGGVEVVAVVVVAEQDRVDRGQVDRGDRRAGELARHRAPAEEIPPTRRIESRVGQQPPAADLDEDRRAADMREADVLHARVAAAWVAWPSAQSNA